MVGTDRDAPRLLVVPQPRDRDLRFAFLAELAAIVLPYIERRTPRRPSETGHRRPEDAKVEVAVRDAPQLIVPEPRRHRVRTAARPLHALPPRRRPVPGAPAGAAARPLADPSASAPGPRLVAAAGDDRVLAGTGRPARAALEDQHLGALLAWIDPPDGMTGAEAALRAEDHAGAAARPPGRRPTRRSTTSCSPPRSSATTGGPARRRGRRRRDAVRARRARSLAAAAHLGRDVAGVDLLRALPEGAPSADRWTRDRWSFTGHRDRVAGASRRSRAATTR